MKTIAMILTVMMSLTAFAGVAGMNGTTSLGIFDTIKCSTGLTCSKVGSKLQISKVPSLENTITATATTLTASQCGSSVINSGAVVINLPAGAASLIGCKFTFITTNASNFDVNPGNSDQIVILTNAAGDAIRNATIGNSVVLQYVSTNVWAPVGKEQGTWTDIN